MMNQFVAAVVSGALMYQLGSRNSEKTVKNNPENLTM